MNESQWETLDSSDIIDSILTPTSSNNTEQTLNTNSKFQLPVIECNISDRKLNLFDRFEYAKLYDSIMIQNFNKSGIKKTRNLFFNWLEDSVDMKDPKCAAFMNDNQQTLKKLKNKRQLVMFLNRKFEQIHTPQSECKPKLKKCTKISFTTWFFFLFHLLAYFTFFLLLCSATFFVFLVQTNYIEQLFEETKYWPFLKAFKLVVVSLLAAA